MTLRVRLLLAFGYLVTLVLVVAASSTFGFLHLATRVEAVLTENYRTIQATLRMTSALERLDRSTLGAQVPDGLESDFLEALAEAEANVTEAGEPEALASIRASFEVYRRAGGRFSAQNQEAPLVAYERDLAPLREAVERSILDLREINQQAMFRAERAAKRTAVRSAAWLGALVALSLLSFVFMSNALHRRILDRLDDLRDGVSLLGSGDRVRRLRDRGGDDEFAVIAREINRLIDRGHEAESRAQGRLARERRLTLGLLARCGHDAALFSRDGHLLAGGLAGESLHQEVGRRLREVSEASCGEVQLLEPRPGVRLRAEPVASAPEVPVAWLVTPGPSAS